MAGVVLVDRLRNFLVAEGLVRKPDQAGPGARPWLPPAWKHPDGGAVGPGDAKDQGRPATAQDDGLVVSIFMAPGIPPIAGAEDRRQDGIDLWFRGSAVPPIIDLEAAIRARLVGPGPGGMVDWVMDGLYVIQSTQFRPFQPLEALAGVFTFSVGYVFELRAT